VRWLLALAILFAAPPAWAQRWELALLGGYTTEGGIDKKAPQFQELEIESGFTWGVVAGRSLTPHLAVEVSWARQESALGLEIAAGEAELFDLNVDQIQAAMAYQLGGEGARIRPFLLAGLGAAIFSAREPENEAKLSLALGAGVKWHGSGRVGARLQARYLPTHLSDASSDFCDPFGFCQAWLQQFELTGGVTLRF
jgi:opacity protein-like surface antigen